MKNIFLSILTLTGLCSTMNLSAQTVIASSQYSQATANHSQRKIVRDSVENLYVVYVDSTQSGRIVKGLRLDRKSMTWSEPISLASGSNPTLAIGKRGTIHLVYESDGPVTRIIRKSTDNFVKWGNTDTLGSTVFSSRLPVADVDSDDRLNLFWIGKNADQTDVLAYAAFENDSLTMQMNVMSKPTIKDLAIANHLTFQNNDLFFAIHFSGDSLLFFRSIGGVNGLDTLHAAVGSFPCISFNSVHAGLSDFNYIRLLYLDEDKCITDAEKQLYTKRETKVVKRKISSQPAGDICIDDTKPGVGYSYLFTRNDTLYHGFSYGASMGFSTVLDTLTGHPLHPSIAYKNFNFQYVDFIWMEKKANAYVIQYKRDDKYHWIGGADPEFGKGFSITGYPNPFSESMTIQIVPDQVNKRPKLEIFDRYSRSVFLYVPDDLSQQYTILWNGTDQKGAKLPPGVYILVSTVGDKRVARKVVLR